MDQILDKPYVTQSCDTGLAVTPITYNQTAGRWRTEAMRSHATPRLMFITKGQGRITVAGMTSGYGPNNLIFIPAHVMYGYEAGPSVFGSMLSIPNAMANEWPEQPVHLRVRDVHSQMEAARMFEALERELANAAQTHSRAAHYHLGLLSVYFERQIEQAPAQMQNDRASGSSARLVAAYTDLIERDYRTDKGVADYAAALGVTATHLTRCCNQTCGKSALALLRDRVTYEACVLLRETKLPVSKIAADLGFRSAAYFTRSFQSKTGHTPTHFRKFGAGRLR
ncbi:MAG: AraC family transcriptional regulator [Pseudomonadota bacterium]